VRYWWVNQKQTHRHEIGGGYLWSPKRRVDDSRNQFYENMRVVAPGDLVFSYWTTAIRAYGIVRSFGYDAPKPDEFGAAGRHWAEIGYRADVDYVPMTVPVMPRDELAHWIATSPASRQVRCSDLRLRRSRRADTASHLRKAAARLTRHPAIPVVLGRDPLDRLDHRRRIPEGLGMRSAKGFRVF
jgi:hypothetical protein